MSALALWRVAVADMPGPGWSTHKLNPNRMQIERTDFAVDFAVVDYLKTVSRGALEDFVENPEAASRGALEHQAFLRQ